MSVKCGFKAKAGHRMESRQRFEIRQVRDCERVLSMFLPGPSICHCTKSPLDHLPQGLCGSSLDVLASRHIYVLQVRSSKLGMVEVRGIEPLSEDLWRNGSTCVSDSLDFAIAHAHRPA